MKENIFYREILYLDRYLDLELLDFFALRLFVYT